jgi:hypothetical protein
MSTHCWVMQQWMQPTSKRQQGKQISMHARWHHTAVVRECHVLTWLRIYCTMLGVLNLFWSPIVQLINWGLVIPLLQSSITRNYNHTQLFLTLLCVYTIIITYTLVTKDTYNTLTRVHWLTSQLSIIFMNYCRLYIFTLPVSVSYRHLTRRADFHRLTRRTARYKTLTVSQSLRKLKLNRLKLRLYIRAVWAVS